MRLIFHAFFIFNNICDYRIGMTQKKITKKCLYCNTEFDVYKNNESSRKFCSKKCYTNFQNTEYNVQRRRKKIICLFCKNIFEVRNYSHQKYCSLKYKVMPIWENDWNNDKENTMNKILIFLKNEI